MRKGPASALLPLQVAAVVLLTLGALKLYAWSVPGMVSATPDAVVRVPLHTLALLMGLLEIQLGVMVFFLRPLRAAQILTTIGSSFMAYRGLHALSAGPTCPCLAGATSLLPILRTHEDKILLAFSIWFFLVGLWCWGVARQSA